MLWLVIQQEKSNMEKIIIIAEAGVNHNGDLNIAKRLVDMAAESGADYVKFQTFKAEKLVSQIAKKAQYQIENLRTSNDDTQFRMLKKLELPHSWHHELISYCKEKNIKFLSTGFDEESVDFLVSLNLDFIKIPSGEITNKPFLEHVARKNKKVIYSTGMSTLDEVIACKNVLNEAGLLDEKITILQCNTEYPTPLKDVNLRVMKTLRDMLNVTIGFSDHTEGIAIPIAAAALGANVIEKHITLDKSMEGPDHKASLDRIELIQMVNSIRQVEVALGDYQKFPTDSELKNVDIVRKSLHYKNELKRGHILCKSDFISLRPGSGISPMKINDLIGKTLLNDVLYSEIVKTFDFE